MEAVIITVAVAILRVVAKKVVLVSIQHIEHHRSFKRDFECLANSIDMIEKVLSHAQMRRLTDGAVKKWLENLEDVAFETDYVLDKFIYRLQRRSLKGNFHLIFTGSNYFTRYRCGRKIKAINLKMEAVKDEAESFGLQTRYALTYDSNPSASMETDSVTADPIFLGRDDRVSRIVATLTDRSSSGKRLSVIPIVGMGGLGKTMLARKVYHDGEIRCHFGSRSWVYVSQDFDLINVLKKFLTTLTSQTGVFESREAILQKLREALRDRRYFLVVDDVWCGDDQKWQEFMSCLSGVTSTTGNGIIVTSRSSIVASTESTQLETIHLEGLSHEDCWSIIKEKAFPSASEPSEFRAIGKKIAIKCQGLPLAASVVGGVLRGKSEKDWLRIEEDLVSCVEGDDNYITTILRLSFDYLHSPMLKKCFMYCSVFPRGEEMEGEELIELWMAEGFLESDGEDMELVGNTLLEHLLQSSLLHAVKSDRYGNVTRYGMHDLVHGLASNLSRSSTRIRYLGSEPDPPMKKDYYLRTLFCRNDDASMLFRFKCLRALTLTGENVIKLSASITKLILLRYLNISYTGITSLPNSMDNLCLLQTFKARGAKLTKLPTEFTNFVKLRHLHIDVGVEMPPNIRRITSLRTLACFRVSSRKGCRIGELGNLHDLKGKLRIDNLEEVHGQEEAESANLCQKQNLIKLRFSWDKTKESEANGKNVLGGLQPPRNLKSLSIEGFQSESFPSWTMKMAVRYEAQGTWQVLYNLIKIKLSNCCNCVEIPGVGLLPKLKFLHLKGLHSVTAIGSSFYGIGENERFPALETLTLTEMTNLQEWEGVEAASGKELSAFPRLQYLRISRCKQLRRAPSHFRCLRELDIYEMDSCKPLEDICGVRLRSLREVNIEGVDGLEYLPPGLFSNNQSLINIKIKLCTRLRKLPDGLSTLNDLRSFTLVSPSSEFDVHEVVGNLRGSLHLTQITISQ